MVEVMAGFTTSTADSAALGLFDVQQARQVHRVLDNGRLLHQPQRDIDVRIDNEQQLRISEKIGHENVTDP